MVDRRRHGGASPAAGTCGMEAKSSRGGNRGNKNLGSRVGGQQEWMVGERKLEANKFRRSSRGLLELNFLASGSKFGDRRSSR
jgi:hypothetical protein